MSSTELIPASNLNASEWLAREALWAIAKSPLNIQTESQIDVHAKPPLQVQWERWITHPQIDDPAGVLGLVVGGNLQRASLYLSQGDSFDVGSYDRNIILGHVAEHTGKLVGGLLLFQVMFNMSPKDWDKPYPHYIDNVISEARKTTLAAGIVTDLLDTSAYYEMLRPAHEAVLNNPSSDNDWAIIRSTVSETAATAETTWQEFLNSNPDILVVPGGTPRSTGPEIDSLRDEFEPYAQLVSDLITLSNP
jgi:hypothetical protein